MSGRVQPISGIRDAASAGLNTLRPASYGLGLLQTATHEKEHESHDRCCSCSTEQAEPTRRNIHQNCMGRRALRCPSRQPAVSFVFYYSQPLHI
eukprot:scaffold3058_cov134-Isochrysis_galbana.AAC.4